MVDPFGGKTVKSSVQELDNRPRRRHERIYLRELTSLLEIVGLTTFDSSSGQDSPIYGEGTVCDLVSLNVEETMYPHQRGGFKFIWKRITRDITL
ncbi:hypothetical protein RDI58_001274 [Solanum bulbocastanum]|uniref:Uncharacterized protein n=1 Tax=Solanum bulbocastanum TaxID=147425 RepID=A0AAN8YPT8_SOLBU